MEASDAGWLVAGAVGSPHGLDGSFHVRDPAPGLLSADALVMIAGRQLRIVRRAGTDRRPIVRLQGCSAREHAEALRGERILVPRSAAPPLGDDEWWAEELVGCAVHDGEEPVGRVKRLIGLPSCEVLEVSRGGRQGDLLVPLVRDAVRAVDVERREIDIDLEFLGESSEQ